MDFGYLFSPYGRPSEFIVAGVARGLHATRPSPIDRALEYHADVIVDGAGPSLFASALLLDEPPAVCGPRVPSPEGPFSRHRVHTPAWGFADALLGRDVVSDDDAHVAAMVRRLVITAQGGEHMRVLVVVAPADDGRRLGEAITLVRTLVSRVHQIALEGTRFADAFEMLRARGLTGEPREDALRTLRALIDDKTRVAHGVTERVKDSIESRLHESHGGLELEATLTLRPCDVEVAFVDVAFQGVLPPVDVRELVMTAPEPSGPLAFWRTWREHELGDEALDDAFLVEGDARTVSLVKTLRAELLALAPHSARVAFASTTVAVQLSRVPTHGDVLATLVDELLSLWRQVVTHRLGLRPSEDA